MLYFSSGSLHLRQKWLVQELRERETEREEDFMKKMDRWNDLNIETLI